MAFSGLGLDPRLLRGLEKKGFAKATPVQLECIPHALEGKDIVARARTGSGKTLAYVLPALHKLASLPPERLRAPWQVLILVPTRELCEQVKEETESISAAAGLDLIVTALTATGAAQRDQFLHIGQIVVATPGRIAQALKEGRLKPQMLQPHEGLRRPGLSTLVLDEADLILSMPGYDEDLQQLAPKVPRSCQCLLMSATTNDSVERLQKLVLHSPVALDLLHVAGPSTEAEGVGGGTSGSAAEIDHFRIHCPRTDKLLYTMALLKLGLVKQKVLLFVNSVDAGFRLRLFLESFGIRSAVINAELPLNSRHHILQEFNRGIFDYLIATDNTKKSAAAKAAAEEKGRKRKRESDAEFGVTRGVDFKGVETVINVDAPATVDGYVHRVGRTGRAGKAGVAISLFAPQERELEDQLHAQLGTPQPTGDADEGDGSAAAGGLRDFARLAPAAVEALRYRAEDVVRSLTGRVVQEARAKELRLELLNSQRLEAYFQEHPGDHVLLKHDKPLAKKQEAPHLKHLPPYLRAAGACNTGGSGGVLSVKKRRKLKKGTDPIKGGFIKAPKRGDAGEELTEMEIKAEAYGKKVARKQAKEAKKLEYKPKRNVRKKR